MKKTMKIISGRNFLIIAALTSLLVPGISVAASGPDLRVGIRVDHVSRNTNGTYNFTIHSSVKNIGTTKYISRPNQQSLYLYEGRSRLVKRWGFSRVNRGQTLNFSQSFRNRPGGEFVPSYKAQLVFDPDIYMDGNRANDDKNRRNNQATLRSNTLSSAFNRVTPNARGTRTIQRYNLQPRQNKNLQRQIQPQFKIKP